MSKVMMALGAYRFALDTAAYGTLRRSAEYRWPAQERLGRRPARQFVGPGDETIELEGVIYPSFAGGLGQLGRMREQAGLGEPLILTGGDGLVWGKFCIERVEETDSDFFADGAPRKIGFRLALASYGDDD